MECAKEQILSLGQITEDPQDTILDLLGKVGASGISTVVAKFSVRPDPSNEVQNSVSRDRTPEN